MFDIISLMSHAGKFEQYERINTQAQKLDGWLSPHEGFFLFEAASALPKDATIVEIGSWKGKSTLYLTAAIKNSSKKKMFAVDPHIGERSVGVKRETPTFKQFEKNLNHEALLGFVTPIIKTSEKAAKNWAHGKIDFLFIDGLHDIKNTKLDFSIWEPKVKNGGVIALHDAFCGHDGPELVTKNEFLGSGKFSKVGVIGSTVFATKRPPQTIIERLDLVRHQLIIPLALRVDKANFSFKFFVIHRLLKFLLLNSYTCRISLKHLH